MVIKKRDFPLRGGPNKKKIKKNTVVGFKSYITFEIQTLDYGSGRHDFLLSQSHKNHGFF